MGSGSLNEVKDDLNKVDDINGELNIPESGVVLIFSIFTTSLASLVNLCECKDEGRHK